MAIARKLAHVLYRTHRFEELVDWYQRVFDARVQHADAALAFLSYDDEHHRFAIANLDVLRPDDSEGEQKGLSYMKGPVFAANPVGVEYDPDDWLSQKLAGADLSSLLQVSRESQVSPIRGTMMEAPGST